MPNNDHDQGNRILRSKIKGTLETSIGNIWESHDAMRAMYTDPEQLKEFDNFTKNKRKELLNNMKVKRDQAIILKYKLVQIKQGIQASLALDKFGKTDGKV